MWNTDELSPEEVEALIERTAADADAELAYQRMTEELEDEAYRAELAADDAQAEAQADAEPTIVDHDLF